MGAKDTQRDCKTRPVAVCSIHGTQLLTVINMIDRLSLSRDGIMGSNARPMRGLCLARPTKPANAGDATRVLNCPSQTSRCRFPCLSATDGVEEGSSTLGPHQRHLACVSGSTVSSKLLLERLEGSHQAPGRTTDTHTVRHISSPGPGATLRLRRRGPGDGCYSALLL